MCVCVIICIGISNISICFPRSLDIPLFSPTKKRLLQPESLGDSSATPRPFPRLVSGAIWPFHLALAIPKQRVSCRNRKQGKMMETSWNMLGRHDL